MGDDRLHALEGRPARDVVSWALETFGERIAVVTALQADGMAILDMASRVDPEVRVITVDTGRLPRETIDFLATVRHRYPRARLEVHRPDGDEVAAMVGRFGRDLFRDGVAQRLRCCDVRKVRPLAAALEGLDAWFTGLRRDQSASRAAVRVADHDPDHGGIVKISPLAAWTAADVDAYLARHAVPRHPLYARGYRSIGCAPCTRPVADGEPERAGRWWWEDGAPKECGIHGLVGSP